MPRCLVFALPFTLVALAPAPSRAASEDCPDGWFCDPNAPPPPSAPSEQPPALPAPRPAEPVTPPLPNAAPGSGYAQPGYAQPGYAQPGYAQPGHSAPRDAKQTELSLEVPPDNVEPKRRRRRRFREWGFNVHLEAALLDQQSARASHLGLGGLGFGFRYRLLPRLAFEAGIDLLQGSDSRGYSRSEAALLLNTLVFFNPYDVVQVYGLGGLAFSGANVAVVPRSGEAYFKRREERYSYFGGQLGLGLEVRVTRRVAIAGDLLGFIRGRTDDGADDREFIDGDRRDRTSGGGLLRAGVTFYW